MAIANSLSAKMVFVDFLLFSFSFIVFNHPSIISTASKLRSHRNTSSLEIDESLQMFDVCVEFRILMWNAARSHQATSLQMTPIEGNDNALHTAVQVWVRQKPRIPLKPISVLP